MSRSTEGDIEILREHFPLFEFTHEEERENLKVQINDHHWMNISTDESYTSMRQKLKKPHRKKAIEKRLEEFYPPLSVRLSPETDKMSVSLWTKKKGTGMKPPSVPLSHPDFHKEMAERQDQAQRAQEDGMFYCSGHERVEPKENYGYFYFAGKYCEQYGEENPEHKQKAARENYS